MMSNKSQSLQVKSERGIYRGGGAEVGGEDICGLVIYMQVSNNVAPSFNILKR